jgi:hypothetical protein
MTRPTSRPGTYCAGWWAEATFLHLADSKLCTKENLEHIATKQGRFLTFLPKPRREDAWFRDWLQTQEAHWIELLRKEEFASKDWS